MNNLNKNGARFILSALYEEGIEYFFMVPGKIINPFMCCYNINFQEKIRPIIAAHESGAAYMADGYARATGKFGVCLVIDGPGSVNAVPGIAAAYADNSAVLLIAGRIPRGFEMKGALQDATQSGVNLTSLMKPITASAHDVPDISSLESYFKNAIKTMLGCEIKPAYLAIPKDIQLEEINQLYKKINENLLRHSFFNDSQLEILKNKVFLTSKKICVIMGGKIRSSKITEAIIYFSEKYSIPVATTISSKGFFPEDHFLSLGMFGYSGHRRAIDSILSDGLDLLILIGFDVTQWTTLAWHKNIKPKNGIIQVDRNPAYLGKNLAIDYPIVGDEFSFLQYFIKNDENSLLKTVDARKDWLDKINEIPMYYEDEDYSGNYPVHPAFVVKLARKIFPRDTMLVVDAGSHRVFVAHYWKAYGPFDFFATTTLAPMGWAVPASIGIKIAHPDRPCLVITGDGCMLMNGIEIQTAARYKLKIIYIVVNNGYYGATFFNNRNNIQEMSCLPTHNWAQFASALGLESCIVEDPKELEEALYLAVKSNKTFLLDVRCGYEYRPPLQEYTKQLKEFSIL